MEERRSNLGVWIAAIALLLALPVLYVLSVGPVAAYYEHRQAPAALQTFYAPIIWLMETFEPAAQVFEWYIELWCVNSP